MPTEEDARRLLAEAAATIDVAEAAPLTLTDLPEPTRHRWPVVLAAAAAVVVAIGGGTLVAREIGQDGADTDPATGPVGGEVVLDDDQVPGLVGYTRGEATRLLEDRGYQVRVRRQPDGCNTAGIVTGSAPPVGSRVDAGDTVTIRVVTPQPVIDCVGELPWGAVWDLVRLARGLAGEPDTLSGAVAPPEALATLARLVSRAWPGNASPRLELSPDDPPGCLGREDDTWDLRLWVEVPVDGVFCPDAYLLLRQDDRGGLAEVAVAETPVPVGDDITEEELAESLDRTAAARGFATWAQGDGPPPEFADRVRVLAPGFHPGWTDEPERRTSYSGCSGLGFPDCGLDPVAAIARHDGRFVPTNDSSGCPGPSVPDDGRRPRSETDVVLLVPSGLESSPPVACPAPAVELWIDAEGVIYGVGLAIG